MSESDKAIKEVEEFVNANFPDHPKNLKYKCSKNSDGGIRVNIYTKNNKLLFRAEKCKFLIFDLNNNKQYYNITDSNNIITNIEKNNV